jgi:hypothetical protein
MRYIFLFLINFFISLQADEIAVVTLVQGEVFSKSDNTLIELKEGSLLDANTTIITKNDSMITIIFKDASVLNLGENTLINLNSFVFSPQTDKYDFKLYLEKGDLIFESGKIGEKAPEDFALKTPQGIVSIRGTKFVIRVK